MKWGLFAILLIIGLALYLAWTFFSQREAAVLSILLYRNGDADGFLNELNTASAKFFFSKKLRVLMAIDAYMMKNDDEALAKQFEKADAYRLRAADRLLVLQKELTWHVGRNEIDRAKKDFEEMSKIYDHDLSKKQKKTHEEMMREADYTNAIHIEKDGKYAHELMERAKNIKDDIPCGVTYYKAAQSYYLKGDKKQCQLALEKAEPKLRKTSYHDLIQKMLDNKNYDQILSMKI